MHKKLTFAVLLLAAISSLHAQTNTFPTSGNVGIGTTSPSAKLEIAAGTTNGLQITTANDGPWGLILKNTSYSGGGFGIFQNNTGMVGLYANYPSGSSISISPAGGIGIDPAGGSVYVGGAVVFGVNSGTNLTFRSYSDGRNWSIRDDSGVDRLRFSRGATDQVFWDILKTASSDAIAGQIWYANGAERMRLDSGGNVGVGTANPAARLHLHSNYDAPNTGFMIDASDTSDPELYSLRIYPYVVGAGKVGYQFLTKSSTGGTNLPLVFDNAGNVGIGTTNPGSYKLAVNGAIHAKEVVVDLIGWSDYVFAPDYKLAPLSEVETHIKENGHLPGIPSAKEVAEHGVSMGEMQAKLLAKIEELTLHQIEQEKHQRKLEDRIQSLEEENHALQVR